jgi:hypothetical protein
VSTEEIYQDLFNHWKKEFGSKSEFNCFLAVCDVNRDDVKKNFKDFKIIVDLFLKNRSLNLATPKEWIQALLDSIASKSQGISGETKLLKIAQKHGFLIVNSWDDFNTTVKAAVEFSDNVFNLDNIELKLGIKLPNDEQNKNLDVILKNGSRFAFIEAKHLKVQGGGQNKSMVELISLIKTKTINNAYLCGFLDGVYSNKLLTGITDILIKNPAIIPSNTKMNKQKKEIIESLTSNSNSFWFNTAGFEEFVKDFL